MYRHTRDAMRPPRENFRSCTDTPCLSLLITFLAAWGAVAYYAFSHGDLNRLVPTDSNGLKCGVDSEVQDKPYLVFFDISQCARYDAPLFGCKTPQVCVKECPSESFQFEIGNCSAATLETLRLRLICDHTVPKGNLSCSDIQRNIDRGNCAKDYLKSVPFSKHCLPDIENIKGLSKDIVKAIVNRKDLSGTGQMVVEDILVSWRLVIVIHVLSLFASWALIKLLRWVTKPVAWISILGVIAALCYGIYCIRSHPVEVVCAVIFLFIGPVLLFITICVLRKRIVMAIALFKEGSKAVSAIFSTVFFPFVIWLLQILVIVFSIMVGLYLHSIGDPVHRVYGLNSSTTCVCDNGYSDGDICDPTNFNDHCHNRDGPCTDVVCHFQEINKPELVGYFHALNVLGFFWGMCFVSAFGDMVLAFTFATWYWTYRKKELRFFVLTTGFKRIVRYHLGTIAFGSLINAIFAVIQIVLQLGLYLLNQCINKEFKVKKWLEKFIQFLSTNTYIMCAIHGKDFCSSAKDAFRLRAKKQEISLDKVTGFLFFQLKLLLASGMSTVTYIYFNSGITKALHSPFIPAVMVFVGTYGIATVFFNVLSVAVNTMFLCLLEDCERNGDIQEKSCYRSEKLMKILDKQLQLNTIIPRKTSEATISFKVLDEIVSLTGIQENLVNNLPQ